MEALQKLNYDFRKFYNEETKVVAMPEMKLNLDQYGVGHMVFHSLKKHFGKIAQIDLGTGEQDTYDALFERSTRTALKLRDLGIKPGDIVSICSSNNINCLSTYAAVHFLGAVNASFDPAQSQEDIEHLLTEVVPKVFFVSEDCEGKIQTAKQKLGLDAKIVVFGQSRCNLKYEEFLEAHKDEEVFEPHVVQDLDDLSVIVFSSGSTGYPKGICLSHKYMSFHTGLGDIKKYIIFTSIYWISANLWSIMIFRSGGVKVFAKQFDPKLLWEYVNENQVDGVQVPPYQALQFIDNKPENYNAKLRMFFVAGAATTNENILKIRKALPNTFVTYGFAMSETGLLFNCFDKKAYQKISPVGSPLPNLQYKIVDPDTEQTLGFDEKGELRVKSEYLFKGYHNRDSSDVWDKDGFFKTGDVFYYDEDFSYFCVDRVKEMFKYRGFHITPAKYEGILQNHPDVEHAVLIGIPHPVDEHHTLAAVVLKPGRSVTPLELEEFYNRQVEDRVRIRAGVRILDSVPLTPSGKINRRVLKTMIIKQ